MNTACQAKSLKLLQVAANRHLGDGEYLGKFARLDRPPCFERLQDGMRAFRYGGEAWLAYEYGEEAGTYIRNNLPTISVWTAVIVGLGGVTYILWRRRRRA